MTENKTQKAAEAASDLSNLLDVESVDKKEQFIQSIEHEISKVVNCFETGNDYQGMLILKGIQLAFRLRRAYNG